MQNKGFYTQEEKERRFNFIPFESCLTHRIEVYYKSGASCSSPANFITDQEAIETAITYLNELVERKREIKKIVVLKYDNKGGLNTIYEKEPQENGMCYGFYNPQKKTTADGKRREINFEYMFTISDENEKKPLQAVANMANNGQKNL